MACNLKSSSWGQTSADSWFIHGIWDMRNHIIETKLLYIFIETIYNLIISFFLMIPKNLKSFEQVILNRSVLATDPLPATKLDVRPRFEPWIFCWQSFMLYWRLEVEKFQAQKFERYWRRIGFIRSYSMNQIWLNFNWAEFRWINGNFSFEVPSYSVHTVVELGQK